MKRFFLASLSLVCALSLLLMGAPALAADYDLLNPPVVEVQGGKLRGFMNEGIYTFLGVQYATAERFEMPKAVEPWEGVKSAQAYGPVCPIPQQTAVGADEFVWPHRYWIEDENCQYLNVWTQRLDAEAPKPVMVFLHGGGYTNGSSVEAAAYDGRNLSRFGDVVVVTLNHRLNALGYLDLSAYGEEYKNSVHAGWADLQMALTWIRDNIAAFGGDPENVMVFGQSGGGGKVLALMHMPSAEGLFNKAASHSSGSGARFGLARKEEAQRVAAHTLENLGLKEDQVDQLKTVPYDDLIEAATAAIAQTKEEFPDNAANIGWNPIPDDEYLMSDYCEWTRDLPFMTGSVFSENSSPSYKIGDGRKSEWTEEEGKAKVAERFGDNSEAIISEFAKLFPDKPASDVYFYSTSGRENILKVADIVRAVGSETRPVYEYLFAYEAPVNGGTTAFHCSDLMYVFHNLDIPSIKIATGGAPEAYRIQDQMARAWVNYAYTGDPSQAGLEWKPFTDEGKETMIFDVESGMRSFDDSALRELMPNT